MKVGFAATAPSGDKSGFILPREVAVKWLVMLIFVLAAMQLSMATGRSINWDEFWFYSQVELVDRGEFIQPLQTIHTRLFFWLPAMPGSEVDHIIFARLTMWICTLITASGIYLLAEKISDKPSALLVVAAYMGAGYVLQHSTSFRVDPIVTALLTTALCIAARTRLSLHWLVTLGALIGLAAMVTIKFVLWAPAFAGIALWRWHDERYEWQYVARWFAAGAVSVAVFAALYTLHSINLGLYDAKEAAEGTLTRSAGKMFALLDSPHLIMIGKGAFTGLPLTLAILMVPLVVPRLDVPIAKRIGLMGLWLPILTPFYYVNSLPYFYTFILPPVAVICALALPVFVERYGMALVALFIGLTAAMVWTVDVRGVTDRQRTLITAVHNVFPEPVPYFDCCGMIATFPKKNDFLTRYGVQRYLDTGEATLVKAMQEAPVPLVLDNNRQFSRVIEFNDASEFLPEDAEALRSTYIRFWADIYIAGRMLEGGTAQKWNVLVPGTYTVEGTLLVNGAEYGNGSLVKLDRGDIMLANPGEERAQLIWGRNKVRPSIEPVSFYWTAW